MVGLLHLIARRARWALVAGLLGGLLLPDLAQMIRPYLPHLVAWLVFLTALRIGLRAAAGSLQQARQGAVLVIVFQLVLPMCLVGVLTVLGAASSSVGFALLIMLAAPSISGAPAFTALLGYDPAPSLRLLLAGMAMLPITVLPVLWASPQMGEMSAVLMAAGRLLAVIAGASIIGFALRRMVWRGPDVGALDGITAVSLGVIVVGLMSAVGPAMARDPSIVLMWLGIAFCANFGVQVAAFAVLRALGYSDPVGGAIIAGNRNVALFLVALPPELTEPILIFIGCYQVPMFLTPILLRRLYEGRKAYV